MTFRTVVQWFLSHFREYNRLVQRNRFLEQEALWYQRMMLDAQDETATVRREFNELAQQLVRTDCEVTKADADNGSHQGPLPDFLATKSEEE